MHKPKAVVRMTQAVVARYLGVAALLAIFGAAGSGVRAQSVNTAQQPDYSDVNDILEGRRTLVTINDLVLGGLVLKTSDGTNIKDSDIYTLPNLPPKDAISEVLVRMFDSGHDTLVHLIGPLFITPGFVDAVDPVSNNIQGRLAVYQLPNDEFQGASLATGDFKGDGFNEVVIASKSGVRVVGAVDPEDSSKGIFSGPVWKADDYKGSNANLSVAVGDFAGDGQHEVALSYGSSDKTRTLLVILTVDPKTLTLKYKSELLLVLHGPTFATGVSLAAGRFGTTLHDQLAVGVYAYKQIEPQHRLEIRSFDFDSSLQPIQKDAVATDFPSGGEVVLENGRFNPVSPYDQAAIKYDLGRGAVRLGIASFDNTLKIRLPAFTVAPVSCSKPGLAVGNFSRTEPVPQDPSKTQLSFTLQLAIKTDNCAGRDVGLNIFNVNPPKTADGEFTVDPKQAFTKTTNDATWLSFLNAAIVAGDIQGRSFVLGQPTKVVIQETAQPSVIAAMPPMHVDFTAPAGSKDPTILNLSAIPDKFRTVYDTSETKTNQSSTTNTTSWSFGATQSLETSVEIGSVEDGFGAKAGVAVRAAQESKGFAEREHGVYESQKFDASVATGLSDLLWFTESRFNIYVYPVIGKTVCPSTKLDCKDSEKVPLTIQFSAPDQFGTQRADGNLVPWYQPPWEPGNVFSYPATHQQLQEIVRDIDELSDAQTSRTDSSTATEKASWTKEVTDGATSGVDQNYSFAAEFSVAGACCGRLVSGSFSAELGLSGSTGFSDLNKSITAVGKSAGIGVEKPGSFALPTNYNYPFTPYIFGQKKPGSVFDDEPLDSDVQTFGLLRTAFVADPARNDAGTWWRQAYRSAPDVALNHPSRWNWRQVAVENPLPPNCLNVGFGGTNMDCLDFSPARPDDLWDSNFHVMRGFFISNAQNPGKGPQLTTATAGDKLTLQARVYNYSFAPMPSGSGVHVRFYVQRLDKDRHTFIGDSMLVNDADVVLSPIPPFSDDDGAPLNWVLASTTFDTSSFENSYIVFWVVVWIEDANGNLVPETARHGLKKVPGVLTSLADVPIQQYSNNVGFYNSEFFVFPKQSALEIAPRNGEPAAIDIGKVELSANRILAGQTLDVSAELSATKNSASGVTAFFYDGDPDAGGTMIGLERSPYIGENDTYQVMTPYYARACGKHQLFVVVNKDTPAEVVRRSSSVIVDCAH